MLEALERSRNQKEASSVEIDQEDESDSQDASQEGNKSSPESSNETRSNIDISKKPKSGPNINIIEHVSFLITDINWF